MPIRFVCVCRTVVLWGTYGATLAVLLIFLYLCCMDGLCLQHGSDSATPAVSGTTVAYDSRKCAEQVISGSRWIRLAMFLITVVLIAVCAVVTLVRLLSLPVAHPGNLFGGGAQQIQLKTRTERTGF